MQKYNLKNTTLILNVMLVFSEALYLTIGEILSTEKSHLNVILIFVTRALILYLFNYKILTPYFLREGFTLKKFLIHFLCFMGIFILFSFGLSIFVRVIVLGKKDFTFDFIYWLSISQGALYIFLISTSSCVISLIERNQFFIKNLEMDNQKNKLKILQNSTSPQLISNYISYLQQKQGSTSISNEIIELADFLRCTIYTKTNDIVYLFSELEYFGLYATVLQKGQNLELKLTKNILDNIKIPAFSLVTPLKEIVLENPSIKIFDVYITQEQNQIVQIIKCQGLEKEICIPILA